MKQRFIIFYSYHFWPSAQALDSGRRRQGVPSHLVNMYSLKLRFLSPSGTAVVHWQSLCRGKAQYAPLQNRLQIWQ